MLMVPKVCKEDCVNKGGCRVGNMHVNNQKPGVVHEGERHAQGMMTKLEILLTVTPHRGRGSSGSGRTSFCTGRLIASDDWSDLNRMTPRCRVTRRFIDEVREGIWRSLFMVTVRDMDGDRRVKERSMRET